MGFDWKGYHAQADDLCINHLGGKEAALRTACSRYYYAAFHKVLEHSVKNTNFTPERNGNDHTSLIAHIRWVHPGNARKLDTLRQHRQKSDYHGSLELGVIENTTNHAKQRRMI